MLVQFYLYRKEKIFAEPEDVEFNSPKPQDLPCDCGAVHPCGEQLYIGNLVGIW